MATSPKIMYGNTQMTKVIVNGKEMYDVNVVKDGVTTRVYHKHTSACYSAGHTHTDACYNEVYCMGTWYLNADYKPECDRCHLVLGDWDTTGHTLPEYPCYAVIDRELICGKAEGASTLICGYNV